MRVVAGLWRFAEGCDQVDLIRTTSAMLDAQVGGTSDDFEIAAAGCGAVGGARSLARSGRNTSTIVAPGTSGNLLAIDARVDNRAELLCKLGRRDDPQLTDERLIHVAYERWGEDLPNHLLGDFAIAVWNRSDQSITFFRDPTGQRPLHYYLDGKSVAFASMPDGLFAVGIDRALNAARLSRFVATLPAQGSETFWREIRRVEPAQVVRINRAGVQAHRYWNMPTSELRYGNDLDYVAAFREELDRATKVRLRDCGPIVAAHLSAGLDSGAVAATAARLLTPDGGRVLALTSAPRSGFAGPVPRGRIADESGIAGTVAALYPTMEHIVLRSERTSPLDHLDTDSRLFGEPVGYPCNNVWWRQANAAAMSRGARVMLTGEMGNLTISAGGLGVLADLIRSGQLIAWLRETIALRKNGPRWRGLMAASAAPWIPAGLWTMLRGLSADGAPAHSEQFLLASADGSSIAGAGQSDSRQTDRDIRWSLIGASDPGNFRKGALLKWGIDERDPTSDRRLIEFCLSLPPSQLLGDGRTRRLARTALSDRLPAAILDGVRGYQYADWYEALDRNSLGEFARRTAVGPAAEIINFDAVGRLITEWPPGDWASARTIGTYRMSLLRALSAAAFALNATG